MDDTKAEEGVVEEDVAAAVPQIAAATAAVRSMVTALKHPSPWMGGLFMLFFRK
jgi:hypothetical protein